MKRPTLTGKVRSDSAGDGRFGARRGGRPHRGTDYEVIPGDPVMAPMIGTIVRMARPYAGTAYSGALIRQDDIEAKLFYFEPFPSYIGRQVKPGEIIGAALDISERYGGGMKPHIHLEVRIAGELVDPETLMNGGTEG